MLCAQPVGFRRSGCGLACLARLGQWLQKLQTYVLSGWGQVMLDLTLLFDC